VEKPVIDTLEAEVGVMEVEGPRVVKRRRRRARRKQKKGRIVWTESPAVALPPSRVYRWKSGCQPFKWVEVRPPELMVG
jgi:hypothetical protein